MREPVREQTNRVPVDSRGSLDSARVERERETAPLATNEMPRPAASKAYEFFSPDYFTARDRFIASARRAGARVTSRPIGAAGPAGELLTIDRADFGAEAAKNRLLHISGTHGAEGFCGSAIQLAILSKPLALPPETAVTFIHALNPWGMAHLRRVNESNVDLNRNFFLDDTERHGAPALYREKYDLFNPATPPSRFEPFLFKVGLAVWKHGMPALKAAAVGGQYEFPDGLSFGGRKTEESTAYLYDLCRTFARESQSLRVIDVHSGLGDFGGEILLGDAARFGSDIAPRLGRPIVGDMQDGRVGYTTRGSLSGIARALGDHCAWVVEEFGTYSPIKIFSALRAENRYHQFGDRDPEHRSKLQLREMFDPAEAEWKAAVLDAGVDLFSRLLS